MSQVIQEDGFQQRLRKTLSPLLGQFTCVTGPGRSGAICAVYASYFLRIPYMPMGCNTAPKAKVLVVDTVERTGRTLRKAARRYPDCTAISVFGKQEDRHHFWYEYLCN